MKFKILRGHYQIGATRMETVNLLLRHGADFNLKDFAGKLACERSENKQIAKCIADYPKKL